MNFFYNFPLFNHLVFFTMLKGEHHSDLEFLEPEAGVADVEVALFAEVFDLHGSGGDDDVDDDDVDGD